MKSTLSYSTSILSVLALTSALSTPRSSNSDTVHITISSGNGDAASTLEAGIGATTTTKVNTAKSVKSSLFQDNVWCGGFKDAEATNLWLNFNGTDGIFSTGIDARYSSKSGGGVDSKLEDAVTVASYWCADSLAGVQNRIRERTLPPREAASASATISATASVANPVATRVTNGGNNGVNSVATPQQTQAAAPANNGDDPVVNIQLETESGTTFFGEEIIVNGEPQIPRVSNAISIRLTTAVGVDVAQVTCEVLREVENDGAVQFKVIATVTADDATDLTEGNDPVDFDAVRCSA